MKHIVDEVVDSEGKTIGWSIIPSAVEPGDRGTSGHSKWKGFFIKGYTDDIVICMMGKELQSFPYKLWKLWKKGARKFTLASTQKNCQHKSSIIYYSQQTTYKQEMKYLGPTLDAKLNWNAHLQKLNEKGNMTFMATSGTKAKTVDWIRV